MKINFSKSAGIGALIGWFVIAPILSGESGLIYGVCGLITTIILGWFFGAINGDD